MLEGKDNPLSPAAMLVLGLKPPGESSLWGKRSCQPDNGLGLLPSPIASSAVVTRCAMINKALPLRATLTPYPPLSSLELNLLGIALTHTVPYEAILPRSPHRG